MAKRTMAQALIAFFGQQWVERDGVEHRFVAGCFGIFGHGNVAGIGQALQQQSDLRYYQPRNEQAMVHTAAAYARHKNRLGTFACTSSVGPGATNMVTGAATATINRLPVLLLPGDVFARRNVGPVLQQLEYPGSQDVSVNDCFRPVSRYWDRIQRAEQLLTALPEAMRVLASPAETGAVTLCLPQDVQAEAYDYPEALFAKRVWRIGRPRPEAELVARAATWIRESKKPLVVAGGGVIYSEATAALAAFAAATGIPVAETQAGKGSLHDDAAASVGAVGATGTLAANRLAHEADLVIGIGTRWSDFTTASKTAFANPNVRFVNVNVAAVDAAKHHGLGIVADARVALTELGAALVGWQVDATYAARVASLKHAWNEEVTRLTAPSERLGQAEIIACVNAAAGDRGVVVCAAGSLPGDLHKLWRAREPKSYHVEYGYSCMGYEIAGGLGVKLADATREVFVMVGDGSYLMMAQEIVTAVQEDVDLTIVLVDNRGFASIGGLSTSLGSEGFGCAYRKRGPSGALDGEPLPVDLAENAKSLGAHVVRVASRGELEAALAEKRRGVKVIAVLTDAKKTVPSYESWWDVPVAEVSTMPAVQAARARYEIESKKEKTFL